MSGDLFPEKIIRTRDADGNMITSEVYSFESWGNMRFAGFLIALFFAVALAPFFSSVMVLFYLINTPRDSTRYHLYGLATSTYVVIDNKFQWLLSIFMQMKFDVIEMQNIFYLNIATGFINLALIFCGEDFFEETKGNKLLLFLYLAAITTGFYFLAKKCSNNAKPITRKTSLFYQPCKTQIIYSCLLNISCEPMKNNLFPSDFCIKAK